MAVPDQGVTGLLQAWDGGDAPALDMARVAQTRAGRALTFP